MLAANKRYLQKTLSQSIKPKKESIMKEKRQLTLKQKEGLIGYGFISVWIIGFLIFTLYPIIYSLFLSFQEVALPGDKIETTFVGWDNFKYAFNQDMTFISSFSDYFSAIIIYVPVIVVFALIIAMLLNSKLKGTGFFRTLFFLPVVITSGPVIKKITDLGLASLTNVENLLDITALYDFLPQLLAKSIDILVNSFIMILWFSGVQILIFIAGLNKIDKSMYEAAKIDGANKWEVFWKITFPVLNPMVVLNVVYTVVTQSLFAQNAIVIKISKEMVSSTTGYGYASALAWLYTFVILLMLGVWTLLFFKKEKRFVLPEY